PVSSTYLKLQDFDYYNGANPYIGSAFIEVKECISKTYYRDADRDGYGNPNGQVKACTQPAGYVTNNSDCDDNNKAVHDALTYYRDADHDGFGDPAISVRSCTPPPGYVKNNFDCNDHRRAHRPWMERVRMCHHGIAECVYVKDIFKMLCHGWRLGPCPKNCGTTASRSTLGGPENPEKFYEELAIPQQYKLSNYPNPFAGTSTIKYELPLDSKVSIKVYDVFGRTVATLVDDYKKAGAYTVSFNAGHLSSGSLYYRMIATSKDNLFEQTNQMILIR
ncbi:MAG: T9SS type A sorting domain-containing protein, partial [Ferruginibacter sp.]